MFQVIGERINTSRKNVLRAVAERDVVYIQEDVKNQAAAGVDFIDVNAGACIGNEMKEIAWLIEVIQDVVTIPLCLDSPDPRILERAFVMVKKPPMINSISLEKNRYDTMLAFLKGKECKILALCMDDSGMPKDSSQVLVRAKRLVSGLEKIGVAREHIYLDPLVQPISTESTNGMMALEAIKGIRQALPGVRTICGLSNISYGLPARKEVNRKFVSLMMVAGLSAAIVDPLDRELMAAIKITEMLLGKDEYCARFLKAYRAGHIKKECNG